MEEEGPAPPPPSASKKTTAPRLASIYRACLTCAAGFEPGQGHGKSFCSSHCANNYDPPPPAEDADGKILTDPQQMVRRMVSGMRMYGH